MCVHVHVVNSPSKRKHSTIAAGSHRPAPPQILCVSIVLTRRLSGAVASAIKHKGNDVAYASAVYTLSVTGQTPTCVRKTAKL